jgi:hypothetical protein
LLHISPHERAFAVVEYKLINKGLQMTKALGIDDSVTTCDCCGKSNLKSTVIIELDSGEIVHYGSVCAQRNTGKAPKQIKQEINDEATKRINAAYAEWSVNPANLAYQVKMKQSREAGLVGVPFINANRAELDASNAERERIAAKHGVRVYDL